jgi:SPP1 family predicted phage head-tail adaptor
MQAGKLNRLVTILVSVDTQEGTYGTKERKWVPAAKVRAEVQDILPSRADRVAGSDISLTRRPSRIRMRWRDDVSMANRIELDGRQMRIVAGPAMIGRRQRLELMVEELSTEGQQP